MKWLKKQKMDDVTQAHWDIVNIFSNIHNDLLEFLMKVTDTIKEQKFHEASGQLSNFYNYTNQFEEYMKLYFNTYFIKFIESEAKLSHSIDDIKEKENRVKEWLTTMNEKCDELIKTIRQTNDPNIIKKKYLELNNKCTEQKSFIEYIGALRTSILEYRMYEKNELIEKDKLKYIFNNLNINSKILKASKRLFIKSEYEASIFEAYKMVEEQVKIKSNIKNSYGKNLMAQVFNENNPILIIQDPDPLQQKNKQEGLKFLFMGAIITMKNPLSHRVTKKIDPNLALHYLILASVLLNNLESCTKIK